MIRHVRALRTCSAVKPVWQLRMRRGLGDRPERKLGVREESDCAAKTAHHVRHVAHASVACGWVQGMSTMATEFRVGETGAKVPPVTHEGEVNESAQWRRGIDNARSSRTPAPRPETPEHLPKTQTKNPASKQKTPNETRARPKPQRSQRASWDGPKPSCRGSGCAPLRNHHARVPNFRMLEHRSLAGFWWKGPKPPGGLSPRGA